jgi:CheY-like chemotaxis protein
MGSFFMSPSSYLHKVITLLRHTFENNLKKPNHSSGWDKKRAGFGHGHQDVFQRDSRAGSHSRASLVKHSRPRSRRNASAKSRMPMLGATAIEPKKRKGVIMESDLPLRVLVVDNDELVCAATTGMLELLGHRADAQTDGLSALKVFSDGPDEFDLAIIEPMLPGLMGLDLAIRFRHIRPGFPVLFYTGYVDESLSRGVQTASVGRVVFKPVTLNELAAAMNDGLVKPRGSKAMVRRPWE